MDGAGRGRGKGSKYTAGNVKGKKIETIKYMHGSSPSYSCTWIRDDEECNEKESQTKYTDHDRACVGVSILLLSVCFKAEYYCGVCGGGGGRGCMLGDRRGNVLTGITSLSLQAENHHHHTLHHHHHHPRLSLLSLLPPLFMAVRQC